MSRFFFFDTSKNLDGIARQRSNLHYVRVSKGALLFFAMACWCSCQSGKPTEIVVLPEENITTDLSAVGLAKLSDYKFFEGDLKDLSPVDGVIHYTLNSSLFSDYAFKSRFIKFPSGTKATYNSNDVFDFPDGTTLIKNFYYPADFCKPLKDIRILETRLLINQAGTWKALPYVWNDAQTEAYLNVAGKSIDVSWRHYDGALQNITYSVPNMNQCKGCHLRGDQVKPIGLSARQLNGDHQYQEKKANQLVHWQELNLLKKIPSLSQIPRLVSYDDEQVAIDKRARAWLEINCAHCHRADGPAKTSGLFLLANENDPSRLGVGKAPVAAGKGSGGLLYGIVPGKPEESILQFRIESVHPGIMMPELGRSIVHYEGVELVRMWILEMKGEL